VGAFVEFIVDTGCTATVLHPLDAVRHFGVSDADLARPDFRPTTSGAFGVGGPTVYFPMQAAYGFADDSGSLEVVVTDVRVAQLTAASQVLPSLLGWDVLRHFKLTTNQQAGEVTLERLRP
jgi:hypothetical protein